MTAPTVIYTDGAYSNKNDIGGWAFVKLGPSLRKHVVHRGAEAKTTNNRMELRAIERALDYVATTGGDNVILYSDSQYCLTVCASHKPYMLNSDIIHDIRETLRKLASNGVKIDMRWVRGHSGITGNVIADYCAVRARDEFAKALADAGV